MKEKIFMKHLRTEMKKHIEIPCHKKENREGESAEIGLYIMYNKLPQRVAVRVLSHPAGYILTSYIATEDGDISKLISQTKLNYFNCTEDNNEVYVAIRDHIVGLLRRSDLKNTLSRYYGMLSSKFIAKPLDDYIIAILQTNSMHDFIYSYDRLVYDLVTTINSRTRNAIDSIELDNKPFNDIFAISGMNNRSRDISFEEFNRLCENVTESTFAEFCKVYDNFILLPPAGCSEFNPISLNPYPNNIVVMKYLSGALYVNSSSILQSKIEQIGNHPAFILPPAKSFRNLWGLLS